MSPIKSAILASVGLAMTFLFSSGAAHAQGRSQSIVQSFIDVDGSGNSMPGCGGAGGGTNLIATMNTTFGTSIDDESAAIANRRALYRLCDVQTGSTNFGWTGGAAASQQQQDAQAREYAPEEVFSNMNDSNAVVDLQSANVARRLAVVRLARRLDREANEALAAQDPGSPSGLRLGAQGVDERGPVGLGSEDKADQIMLALQNGINAGDEPGGSGISAFLNGRINIVNGDGNASERASDGFGGGFTLGADTGLSDQIFVGAAFGYTHIDTNFASSASESDLDAVTFTFYGAYYPTDEIYVDGSVSTSWLGFDSRNEVVVFDGGPPVGSLSGETDGVNFGVDLGTGYSIPIGRIGPVEGLMVEPFVRLGILYTEIDGFEQRGGDSSLNLGIRTQKSTSVTGTFGGRAEYPISTRFGVLTPYARLAYVHEFNQESDDLTATPTAFGSGSPSFKLKAEATDSHYGNLGLGVAATLGQGLSQFADYDAVIGHDNVVVHQITAGIRLEF